MTFQPSFHIVEIIGVSVAVFIDDGTRKQIEQELRSVRTNPVVFFDDIYGSEHTVSIDKIAGIFSSTPEIRQSYFEHNQAIDDEKRARGDFREE